MSMLTDEELFAHLPNRRAQELRRAIGRTLLDVRRVFVLGLESFHRSVPGAADEDYFARNSGSAELVFDGDVTHTLAVWGEQLSVVVLDERLTAVEDAPLVCLGETDLTTERLRALLGRRCSDVRIWTFREDLDSSEAKQAAVSYVLGDEELFYGIYLHGSDDNDALMLREEILADLVESCFSLAEGRPISA